MHECRACLVREGAFQSVFSIKEGLVESFAHMIMCCFSSIHITLNDGLPNELCSDCVEKVLEVYKFKLQIDQSEVIIRSRPITLLEDANNSSRVKNNFDDKIRNENSDNFNAFDNIHIKTESSDLEIEEAKIVEGDNSVEEVDEEFIDESENEELNSDCETSSEQLENTVSIYCNEDCNTKPCLKQNKEGKYQCNYCSKEYVKESSLKKHLLNHMPKCSICNEMFTNQLTYKKHLKQHSDKKCFECQICQGKFLLKCDFMQHLHQHLAKRSNPKFKCASCHKEFKSVISLTNHLNQTHNRTKYVYNCNVCRQNFDEIRKLQQHLKQHIDCAVYDCCNCEVKFPTKKDYLTHMLLQHQKLEKEIQKKEQYLCNICKKSFSSLRILINHKFTHHATEKQEEAQKKGYKRKQFKNQNLDFNAIIKIEDTDTDSDM